MKFLTLTLSLLLTLTTFAKGNGDNKDGGNGQLVVIPKGETKPVPYEAVRAWETGKYLNFYRLPNVKGNIEPRAKFNRSYGVHALEWLDLVKDLSPKVHEKLIQAAHNTSFRIVNEYILWEHKPYPDGEIDYKKHEKAAYFNGEIILSTPVMDKMGPLNGQLTKEQNQGFVVVHELINAAYQDLTVAEKLEIGKALIRAKVFGDNQVDFYIALCEISDNFLLLLPNEGDFVNLVEELIRFEKDAKKIEFYQKAINFATKYAYRKVKLVDVFEQDVINQGLNSAESIKAYLNEMYLTLNKLGFPVTEQIITFESLKNISTQLSIPLIEIIKITDPFTKKSFQYDGLAIITEEVRLSLIANFKSAMERGLPHQHYTLSTYIEFYETVSNPEERLELIESIISRNVSESNAIGYNYLHLPKDTITKIIKSDLDFFTNTIESVYDKYMCSLNLCIDKEKTFAYYRWKTFLRYGQNMFAYKPGDSFICFHGDLRAPIEETILKMPKYKVLKINKKNTKVKVLENNNEKLILVDLDKEIRNGHQDNRRYYGQYEKILFLKN